MDYQVVSGAKGKFGNQWEVDMSLGYSGNNLDLYARNTVNPSLGMNSPTQFYSGSLNVTQTLVNVGPDQKTGQSDFCYRHRNQI